MKLIKPSFEIIEQQSGLDGMFKQIELAGRTCYKSEDKITETSAKEFVDRLIKSGHTSVLEHGSIYLYIETDARPSLMVKEIIDFYKYNKYSHVNSKYILDKNQDSHTPLIIGYKYYISTNLRVCIENDRKEFLNPSLLCEPTEFHEKRVCVRFILPIGISREFCRHRSFSFAEMSTRYCNFSKDRFNKELTFIIPPFSNALEGHYSSGEEVISANLKDHFSKGSAGWIFYETLSRAEKTYIQLVTILGVNNKPIYTPQQARDVLPLATKTELVMTGFVSDWKHFFKLRCDTAAHPQARELAIPLKEEFMNRGYI